jgi:phage-related protein
VDWEIVYYSNDVQETIGAWPMGIRAYYARITERMCALAKILILHAYIKKSQKTPARELEVARKRLAEVQRRGEKWER